MRKTILQLYCILLLLGPADLFAQARHWVGGTGGNWNDPLKWSTVSGGAGGAGAPTAAQDALFDANSFTAPGGVVVVTGGATCRRMNWTGVTNGPVLSLSNPLTIDGNGNALVLTDGMSVIGASDLIFRGAGNITVNMGTTGKTVGALKFTANAPKNITLATGDGLHTHSFGVITTGNNSTLNVTGNSTRIYAGMSIGGNAELITQGTSRFTGDVLIDGTVTASAGATLLLGAGAPINATFTGGGDNTFGNVIIGANAQVTFSNNGNNAFGNVTTGSNATVAFPNSGNNTFGDFSINNSTTGTTSVTFSNQSNRFNAVTLNNTSTGIIRASFSNSVLSEYNTIAINNNSTGSVLWQFTAAGTSSVTGSLTVNVACPATAITSSGATPATVNFSSAQVIAGASVSKLTATGAGLTVTNGLNGGGNTGVAFIKAPRAFHWRTNTGNWSDAGKWVVWNGTVFVPACSIPTNLDDVTFDNASFTANTQRVILNVNGQCRSMQWLGIPLTRLPGFESPAANILTLSGNLELSPATVTTAFFGKVVFASSVPGRTINTAGKTLGNVDFNGPGGSWQLVGNALVSNGTVSLIAGTCDANGQPINANALNANGAGNLPRGLLLGSATHTLKGTGLVLDLRGNDNNFTLDPGTSTIQFTGNPGTAGLLTVETGTHPKTLPHLLFTGAGNHTLSTTGITTNRITFGDIHFSNVNGKNVNVLGDNPKTYGNIYFNGRDNMVAFNGTSNALPNGNTFGSVTFADGFSGAQATFRGNNVFNGAVSIHANGATAFANLINFTGTNAFKGTFTARLNNTAAPELQFASTGANTTAFYGAVSINPGHTKSDAVFYNATTFYPGANLSLGGATDAVFTGSGDNALQDVTVNAALGTTTVTFNHNGNSTFRNVTLDATAPAYPSGGITWKFKAGGSVTATFSGNMNIKAACGAAVTIDSDVALQQARVAFSTPQTWNNNVTVRNINAVNASGSINAFQPGTNNVNVFYPVSTANRTLYWVGGSGNWHDPFRWSTSSGGKPGACIPTANDNVLFDVNSGLGAGHAVSIAGSTAFCRSMNWTGTPAGGTTLNLNTDNLEINGSLTLAPGLSILPADPATLSPAVIFTSSNTTGNVANATTKSVTTRTITLPGGTTAALPNVLFNDAAVSWALVGPAPFRVAYRLGLRAGTLQTNDVPVACNNLTTNYWEDLPRTFNITNSPVVITGSEATGLFPALDLTGNNVNFVTPGANARFQFTNSDLWIIIRTGTVAKELPNMLFESIPASLTTGPSNIDIFTHDGSSRITFRGIRITKANGSQLFVVGKCPKTYKGDLIFPDHFWDEPLESRSFDGSSAAEPNNNIFEGEVRFGDHCGVQFKGNNTFRKKVFFGAGAGSAAPAGSQAGVVFKEFNAFEDDVVIAGTADADDAIQFAGTNIFRPGAELTIAATVSEPTRGTPTVQFNNLSGTSSFYDHVTLQGNRSIYRFSGPASFFGADKKPPLGSRPGSGSSAEAALRDRANQCPDRVNMLLKVCSS